MIADLYKDFSVTGYSEEELKKELIKLSDMTYQMVIKPYNLYVYALTKKVKNGYEVIEFVPDEMDYRTLFNSEYIEDHTSVVTYEDFFKVGLTKDLVGEIEKLGFFFKYIREGESDFLIVPASTLENYVTTICGAGKLYNEIDPINQLYVAFLLRDAMDFNMILRKEGKVAKGFAAFSEKHELKRQDLLFNETADILRRLNSSILVSYFNIKHLRTKIEFIMPDKKIMIKTKDKKFIITPSFRLTMADTGDIANKLESGLIINGSFVNIGSESINLSSDKLEEELTEEIITLSKALDKIAEMSEDEVSKSENLKRILKKIGYYNTSIISKKYMKLYEEYAKDKADTCSKVEVLIEILNLPKIIYMEHTKCLNNVPPEYIMERMAKLSGKVFTINFERECF